VAIRALPHKSTADFTKSMANLGKQYEVPLISTCVAGAVARATSNENVRQAIYSVFQDIAELISFGIPKDAASALELWLARGSQSFLARAVFLLQEVEKLQLLPGFDFDDILEHDDKARQLQEILSWAGEDAVVIAVGNSQCAPQLAFLIELPKYLADVKIVHLARSTLTLSANGVAEKFFEVLDLGGLCGFHIVAADLDGFGLEQICGALVDKAKMLASILSLGKHLCAPTSYNLDSASVFDTFANLIDVVHPDTLYCEGMFVKSPCDLPSASLMVYCELLTMMHRCSSGLAWLSATCVGAEGVTQNGRLKPEVEQIINDISQAGGEALEFIEEHDEVIAAAELMDAKLVCGPSMCKEWLVALQKALPSLAASIWASLLANVKVLADRLRSGIPTYEHFLSDSVYTIKLVKSRLLGLTSRKALTEQSVNLWNALSELSSTQTKHGLASEEGGPASEAKAAAVQTFQDAKKLLTIVSALDILYKMVGAQKILEAQKMALKKDLLPASLIKELEKVCKPPALAMSLTVAKANPLK
jgi:hypothetical protein